MRSLLALMAAAVLSAGAAEAQVTCRANALGEPICVGVETQRPQPPRPFRPGRLGVGAVQAPVGSESARRLTRAGRADVLGNTFLRSQDLPPDRPPPGLAPARNCARDALGNLICR